MFGGHRPCRRGEIKFSIFHVTSRDHVIRGSLWLSFSHHKWPPCQVWWPLALQRRRYFVFNMSHDLMWPRGQRIMWHYGWVSLIISLHPAKFGGHNCCAREEISFFVCHVTSRNFIIRDSCDIMGEFLSLLVTSLQSLDIIEPLE